MGDTKNPEVPTAPPTAAKGQGSEDRSARLERPLSSPRTERIRVAVHPDQENQRRAYILGTLPQDEREQLEASYLADDDVFEQMQITEEELVDSYLRGKLSDFEHARMKTIIGNSPRLLEKARLVQALSKPPSPAVYPGTVTWRRPSPPIEYSIPEVDRSDKRVRQGFWKRFFGKFFSSSPRGSWVALSACAGVLVLGIAPLLVQWVKLRNEVQRIRQEQTALEQQKRSIEQNSVLDRAKLEQLDAEIKAQQERIDSLLAQQQPGRSDLPSDSAGALMATLVPGSLRSGGGKELRKRPGTTVIHLTLPFETNDYPQYRVIIKNAANKEVVQRDHLRSRRTRQGATVVVSVSAKELPEGEYSVRLIGLGSGGASETVEDYQFRLSLQPK